MDCDDNNNIVDDVYKLNDKKINEMKIRRDDDYKPRKKIIKNEKLENEFMVQKDKMDTDNNNEKDLFYFNEKCKPLPTWNKDNEKDNDIKPINLSKRNKPTKACNIINNRANGIGFGESLSQRVQVEMGPIKGIYIY